MKNQFSLVLSLIFFFTFAVNTCRGQWIHTYGPHGGSVKCYATLGPDILAGTWLYGVYLSTDAGIHWDPFGSGLGNPCINALAVIDTVIFAGSWDHLYFSSLNNPVWTPVYIDSCPYPSIEALAVSGTTLFAGTQDYGVFRSADNGMTWMTVNNGLANPQIRSLAISGTTIMAGTTWGAYRSTDNGDHWNFTGLNSDPILSLYFSDSSVFAGTDHNFHQSNDDGLTWLGVGAGIPYSKIFSITGFDTNLFVGTSHGLYLSHNNAYDFSRIADSTGLADSAIYCLTSCGSNVFAGTSNGIFLTSDTADTFTSVGLNLAYVKSMASIGTRIFAATAWDGLFTSSNNGESWVRPHTNIPSDYVNSLVVKGSKLFAGTGIGVYMSADSGATWTPATNGLSVTITCLGVSGSDLFAVNEYGEVYVSGNDGISWTNTGNGVATLNDFAVSGNNIFASSHNGVFLSTDNCASWSLISDGQFSTALLWVNSLAVYGSKLFAGTIEGVYLTENNGSTWTFLANSPHYPVYSLVFSGNNLYAGIYLNDTAGGVYVSGNFGADWQEINQGFIESQYVTSLLVANNFLFAGTHENSTWRRPLGEIVGQQNIQQENLTTCHMDQNYPNPFQHETVVRYCTRNTGPVSLKILNMQGVELETVVNILRQPAGTYSLKWNADAYPAGEYLYRLTTDHSVVTKKLTLLR